MQGVWRVTIDTNPEDCNLHCIMCEEHSPYSDFISNLFRTTGVKRRRMPFQLVEKVFSDAKELGVKEIIPSTMGEPLLYKDFEEMIRLAHLHGIRLNLTTNGTFPKKTASEWAELIVPVTSDVKISWNGASKQIAEQVMTGLDFETTKQKVREFIRVRDIHYSKTGYYCRVTFQLTFMQNNMHELADIVKLAAEMGVDRVKGHHLWMHFSEIEKLSMKESEESKRKWNQYVQEAFSTQQNHLKPDGKQVILENILPLEIIDSTTEVSEHYECPFLDKELWISATGKISPCCAPDNLRQSLGDFGNYQDKGLTEVINSKEYRSLVENYKTIPLCKTCNMRRPAT